MRVNGLLWSVVLAATASCFGQGAATAQAAAGYPVPVVVATKKGPVTTLQAHDFQVLLDGKPQAIRSVQPGATTPLTVGLLFDTSRTLGAMLGDETSASETFLTSLLKTKPAGEANRGFVMQFGRDTELLQDVTGKLPLLSAGLKEVGSAAPGTAADADDNHDTTPAPQDQGTGRGGYGRRGGQGGSGGGGAQRGARASRGSVLYDAVYLAAGDVLGKQKGRRVLVLLTAGLDRHSKESLRETLEAAQRANVVIYAVYVKGDEPREMPDFGNRDDGWERPNYPGSTREPGSDGTYADPDGRKILQQLCDPTGGRVFVLKGKKGLEEIFPELATELAAQYTLTIEPGPEVMTSGFHPLQVSLTDAAAKRDEIQTRAGVYGPAAAPTP